MHQPERQLREPQRDMTRNNPLKAAGISAQRPSVWIQRARAPLLRNRKRKSAFDFAGYGRLCLEECHNA